MKKILGIYFTLILCGGLIPIIWKVFFPMQESFSFAQAAIAGIFGTYTYKYGQVIGDILDKAEPVSPKFNFKLVIRDAVIVFLIPTIGGILIGYIYSKLGTANTETFGIVFLITIVTLGLFGYVLSGFLNRSLLNYARLRHMAAVGLTVWLLTTVNLVLMPTYNLLAWMLAGCLHVFLVFTGWYVSLKIAKNRSITN